MSQFWKKVALVSKKEVVDPSNYEVCRKVLEVSSRLLYNSALYASLSILLPSVCLCVPASIDQICRKCFLGPWLKYWLPLVSLIEGLLYVFVEITYQVCLIFSSYSLRKWALTAVANWQLSPTNCHFEKLQKLNFGGIESGF